MRDHSKLRAYELTDEIALLVYRISKDFPKDEIYGLTSQMRRAAVSVPSNIVEGCARESQQEYLRFLEIAFGSLRELRYQLSSLVMRPRELHLRVMLKSWKQKKSSTHWSAPCDLTDPCGLDLLLLQRRFNISLFYYVRPSAFSL